MAKIVDDLRIAIDDLKRLNGDTAEQMSKTVGVSAQKVHDAMKALEDKISEVVRRKLAGESVTEDPPNDGI